MTTDHPNPSKPRRRWFQYSLRTLFVLVTVLCVWLAVTANRARKQRAAVGVIEGLGGRVYYDYEESDPVRWMLIPAGAIKKPQPPGPVWLRELIGEEYFVSVTQVYFSHNTQITDAGLEHLRGLTNLRQLLLACDKLTYEGVK